MTENQTSSELDGRGVSLNQVNELLDERLDVEAVAQMVEHLDYANKLSGKLTSAFGDVRGQVGRQGQSLSAVQQEVRDLIMDVALLKRSLASLGHVGVMERKRIERELVRELFPPAQPRVGAGVIVNTSQPQPPQQVDCENRLHLCKAACCRIFNAHLTPQEVDQDIYEWDPRLPYALQKNRQGCVHLQSGGCQCTLYESRPNTCRNYSCAKDGRIWQDFEKMILNPELAKRLETLHVDTGSSPADFVGQGVTEATKHSSPAVAPRPTLPVAAATAVIEQPVKPADRPKVAPPNFDELRNMMVPKPTKRFVPPDKNVGANGDGGAM